MVKTYTAGGKPMVATLLAAFLSLGTLALPAVAGAGLVGTSVDIAVGTVDASNNFSRDFVGTVLVQDPDIEATAFGQIFNVNFSNTSLRLDLVNLSEPLTLPSNVFIGFVALNFAGQDLVGLTGGNTNIAGFDTLTVPLGSRLQQGSQFLAFNFEGLTLRDGDFVEVGLNLVTTVDEPASFALILSGLGMLGMLVRRRR